MCILKCEYVCLCLKRKLEWHKKEYFGISFSFIALADIFDIAEDFLNCLIITKFRGQVSFSYRKEVSFSKRETIDLLSND